MGFYRDRITDGDSRKLTRSSGVPDGEIHLLAALLGRGCAASGKAEVMSESGPEKLQRVRQMATDTSGTWDLSPKDQLALRYVLKMVSVMADDLAAYTGDDVDTVLEQCHGELK